MRAGMAFVLLSVRGQVTEVQLDHYYTLYSNRRDTQWCTDQTQMSTPLAARRQHCVLNLSAYSSSYFLIDRC